MVYAKESITVADSAIGFTASKLSDAVKLYHRDAKKVVIQVEGYQIRYWSDGTDPASDAGIVCNPGDVIEIDGSNAPNFKAIRTGANSATLRVQYEI